MFRLHRHNNIPSRSGERIDFKFSNFQAIQVPKGWDKLFVSVISVETGKTVAKSSKAPVRNGNCQWTETLSESILISKDDSTKALEERLFKFVVAMGSARSGILGEATVNMAGYSCSKASVPVLLPLKKCNYGTVLQVKINCLTPRTKLRDEESKYSSSRPEEHNTDHHEMEIKSNRSDDSFSRNVESPSTSSNDLGSTSHPGELQSGETSFSASGSHHSFDSVEGSIGRENISPRNILDGGNFNLDGRQDSISSLNGTSHGNYPAEDPSESNHSLFNSGVRGPGNSAPDNCPESADSSSRVIAPSSSLMNSGSSKKNLLETAEDTIEELRAESKMWERNAEKLMVDLDILRKEFSDQSKKQADLDMELSAAYAERDSLKTEVEQLKLVLEESRLNQTSSMEDSTFRSEGAVRMQKELENEIMFQQESNASLVLQLKKSQDSNIELVNVLQELEETIEKQKVEIENLSALQSKISEMENSIQEKLEENRNLSLQLQESENNLQVNMKLIEQAFENKNNLTEKDCRWNETFCEIETEYRCKLSSKEKEIASLEAKLSESLVNRQSDESISTYESKMDLIREVETLKDKLQELERDCSELTNENLELLFKLKDFENNCMGRCKSYANSSCERPDELFATSDSEGSELKSETQDLQKELKKTVIKNDQLASLESHTVFPDLVEQIQMAFYHLKKPWYNIIPSHVNNEFESDLVNLVNFKNTDTTASKGWADSILNSIIGLNNLLEGRIVQCEEVIKCCELELKERNDDIAEAHKKLEDHNLRENNLSLFIQELESSNIYMEASFSGLEKDLKEKKLAVEKLDRKCSELEGQKRGLELHSLNLEKENVRFSERVSGLEAQLQQSQEKSSDHSKRVENLEANLYEMLEDFALKERMMTSEIDALIQENRNQKEELVLLERLLNQKYVEKTAEVESLVNDLELKLTVSEYERQQLIEETANMKVQLQKVTHLQDEILALKNELNVSTFEKEKLEVSLQSVSRDCKELKSEKIAFLQKTVSEFEECQQKKVVLEEKLQQMESDRSAREALYVQDAELKNELSRIMRENEQFQWKIQLLEDEKSQWLKKTQSLEEQIKLMEEQKKDQRPSRSKKDDNKQDFRDENPRGSGVDHIAKIQLLENELAQALEENNKYKIQLQRLMSEGRNNHAATLKSAAEGDMVPKERYERTKSSLETELRDLRDRYFHISLKYAEVEAERENLVMKLKATRNGKKWFS
ncbi:hypothetical protein U1Q18_014038 [Sarracenia purpurea var. burkii]